MNARAVFAFVALSLIAGRAPAGGLDKAKLRKLAKLPEVSVVVSVQFSSTLGFSFNGEKPDPLAEIARVRKQLKGDPSDAERYLRLGRLYAKAQLKKEEKQADAKAVALCRQQVREHPDDMRWLAQLGDALVSTGKEEEGEKLLRRAVKEAPNEWRGWLGLAKCVDGLALRALLGDEHFSLHFHDAKAVIPELLKRKPTAKQIAEMRRLWKEARRDYDRAVELAPREIEPYFRRIASNWIRGMLEAGLRAVKGEKVDMMAAVITPECAAGMSRIARLTPDDPKKVGSAVFVELLAYILNGKEAKGDPSAIEDFFTEQNRSVMERLPAEIRKSVRWGMERLEKLTKHSDKATAAIASELLADVLMMIKQMNEGRTAFKMPSISESEEEDKTAKIVEHLRRAVDLDPTRDRAWDLLTMLLAEKKNPDEAITIARRRLAVKDNAHNRFYLAKVYADDGQFAKAGKELRAGLKSDSEDLDCRLGLIATMLKRDDAEALKQAGEQLDTVEPQIKQEKSKLRERNYLLLRGIYAGLSARSAQANELFRQILRQNKGETTAARALAALGEPLIPADRQLALDYLKKQGATIEEGEQPDSPVEKIGFNRKNTEDDLFFLTALPRLRSLYLMGFPITDAGLAHLKGLTALQNLNLDVTKISDKGLIHLKTLTKLRDLSMAKTEITDAGLVHLEHLRDLESLDLCDLPLLPGEKPKITHVGLSHLRKLTKLRDVSVGVLTDEGLAHLAALPRLRMLYIMSGKITDNGMKHFERLTELEELWLGSAKITDAGVAHLKGLRNLRKLNLGHTKIADAGLTHLKRLSHLEELDLNDTTITDAGLAHLSGLNNLKRLNLRDREVWLFPSKEQSKGQITGAGLKYLQGLTKLTNLDLDGHTITDAGLSNIEKLTRIESLSLDATDITDAGLTHLLRLKKLESVSVRKTKVTDKGIAELRKVFPKLQVYR